jgi:hypothetical protein
MPKLLMRQNSWVQPPAARRQNAQGACGDNAWRRRSPVIEELQARDVALQWREHKYRLHGGQLYRKVTPTPHSLDADRDDRTGSDAHCL